MPIIKEMYDIYDTIISIICIVFALCSNIVQFTENILMISVSYRSNSPEDWNSSDEGLHEVQKVVRFSIVGCLLIQSLCGLF